MPLQGMKSLVIIKEIKFLTSSGVRTHIFTQMSQGNKGFIEILQFMNKSIGFTVTKDRHALFTNIESHF